MEKPFSYDVLRLVVPENKEAQFRRLFVIALWLTFAFFGSTPSWNPNSRFDLVRAAVEKQTFSIDAFHDNTGDKSFFDGHVYSDKAPGLAFLAMPVHATYSFAAFLAGVLPTKKTDFLWHKKTLYVCTILTIGLFSALASLILLEIAKKFGASPAAALCITLLYALGTPALAYSTLFFAHQIAGAFLLFAFACALFLPFKSLYTNFVIIGLLAGCATACEYPALLGAVVIGVFALIKYFDRSFVRTTALGTSVFAGFGVPMLVVGIYNTICFGVPWRIGYSVLVPSRFAKGMGRDFFGVGGMDLDALWGILFGTSRGLFFVSPILLLALLGLVWSAWRSSFQKEARASAIMLLAFLWLNASYVFWNGGAAYGPRHLVPALPFLALGLVAIWKTFYGRICIGVLGLISLANALAATLVGADLPEYGNVLLDHVWSAILENRVPMERYAYNLGLMIGLPGIWSVLPLAIFWAVILPLLLRLNPKISVGI